MHVRTNVGNDRRDFRLPLMRPLIEDETLTGSSNLRMRSARAPSCNSARNAILKKPPTISSLEKLVRSASRRLLMLASSACAAGPATPASAIRVEARIAAGHFRNDDNTGRGRSTLAPIRAPNAPKSQCHGPTASRCSPSLEVGGKSCATAARRLCVGRTILSAYGAVIRKYADRGRKISRGKRASRYRICVNACSQRRNFETGSAPT